MQAAGAAGDGGPRGRNTMDKNRVTDQEALDLHACGRPGKFEIQATKPLTTQRDLSLAYSPGVAAPCLRIRDDESKAYDYTAKGNIVARSEEHTSELQSLMRTSYAVFCLKKKKHKNETNKQ